MMAVNTYPHFRNVMPLKALPYVASWGLLTLLVTGAVAQPLAGASPSQLTYKSPLMGYRAWNDQPVQSWREANERVGNIGGWRAYSRETEAVKLTAPVQPVGIQPPSTSGGRHGQHQQHMERQP